MYVWVFSCFYPVVGIFIWWSMLLEDCRAALWEAEILFLESGLGFLGEDALGVVLVRVFFFFALRWAG